jgi:hypothetical protein
MPDRDHAERVNADRLERERLYQKHGPVLAIGGAKDKTQDGEILARSVDLQRRSEVVPAT